MAEFYDIELNLKVKEQLEKLKAGVSDTMEK